MDLNQIFRFRSWIQSFLALVSNFRSRNLLVSVLLSENYLVLTTSLIHAKIFSIVKTSYFRRKKNCFKQKNIQCIVVVRYIIVIKSTIDPPCSQTIVLLFQLECDSKRLTLLAFGYANMLLYCRETF